MDNRATTERTPACNSTYPKGGVSCFSDTFVVAESSVLRMKFSGKNPALRVAAKRYQQYSMTKILKYIIFLFPILVFGQYPFEKFKSPKISSLEFKMTEKENRLNYSKVVKSFFKDKSDLEVTINGNTQNSKETYIEVKTKLKSNKYFEEIPAQGTDGFYIADFNGDGKKDFKIVCFYMGSGLASMNVRVIYFFQKENKDFTKISFDDKMEGNRIERDLNGDGNFEIITLNLQEYKNHNYWLFNLYNFVNGDLVCVNNKMNYPIMIQFLFKENYNVTKKLKRMEMKKYELKKPKELLIDN
ncbi:MAG: VCBS repeat-containing protein [Flavobacterium sp.]|uniref:FG-GAP repeat domain-containing protein n=1 Tax=Flavobacterium sp. TaxID=239 RepID=UPI0032641232